MSRRHSSKQDSLELLLDTICNTFGGVLFIAILVVLLLQQTSTAPASVSSASTQPVSETELRALQDRWESVSADLSRLRSNRDSQAEVVRQFAPESLRDLLSMRDGLRDQQESLQAKVDRQLAENTRLSADVEELTRENGTVRSGLKAAQSRLQEVRSQFEDARRSRVQEVRMPVLRDAPSKREVGLVLRYGRLYIWHRYGPGGVRLGLNTDDFTVVGEQAGGLVVHPIPTAGVVLEDTDSSRAAVRKRLSQFGAQNCFVTVIARPDSYHAFRYVRDCAIELGLEYRLMVSEADEPVFDRGGHGGKVQ